MQDVDFLSYTSSIDKESHDQLNFIPYPYGRHFEKEKHDQLIFSHCICGRHFEKERQDEWGVAHAQTLNLSLEEVAHIRSVLTKAELEVSHIYFFSLLYLLHVFLFLYYLCNILIFS
jgi:hypothetical protein